MIFSKGRGEVRLKRECKAGRAEAGGGVGWNATRGGEVEGEGEVHILIYVLCKWSKKLPYKEV